MSTVIRVCRGAGSNAGSIEIEETGKADLADIGSRATVTVLSTAGSALIINNNSSSSRAAVDTGTIVEDT